MSRFTPLFQFVSFLSGRLTKPSITEPALEGPHPEVNSSNMSDEFTLEELLTVGADTPITL